MISFVLPAILIGVGVGLVFHRSLGYMTIPIVGLAVGTWWAVRTAGDIDAGTADIFNNRAAQLLGETGLSFVSAAVQASLATWATISLILYLRRAAAVRRARAGVTAPSPERPQRPT